MKDKILEFIEHLKEEKESVIRLQKNAECVLDEGFGIGLKSAYKYVIDSLEEIINRASNKEV